MENQRKCSLNEHKEINAINYCTKCNIYMCNKCLKFHSEIFRNHSLINLEKENGDIFIDICKEENHQNKLEFFCKTHNTLCCLACISKIKKDKYCQHSNCEVYNIEEIKEEKKNNLRTNIDYLDNLSNDLDNSIKELKEMFEKINNNGEKVKLKIQKIFTTIRNEINNREDELLLEVDKQLNKLFFDEEFVKNAEKLPNNIKISLNKGRKTEERWNDNELGLLINNCIKIEKNIEEINKINEKIHNYNTMNDIEVKFSPPNEFKLDNILEIIQNYGKVFYNNIKYSFLKIKNSDSINLNINKGTREKDQTIIPELYIPKIGGGIDINGPKIGGGLDIHGPQIGRGIDIHGPGLDIHGPQIGRGIDIHGPQIGIGLDIHGPQIGRGIDIHGPNLNIHGPQIGIGLDIHGPQIGRGVDIHGPNLNIHGPQIGIGLDIHGPQIGRGVDIHGPNLNIHGPQIGIGLDIHGPKIGGPYLDIDIHGPRIGVFQEKIVGYSSPEIEINIKNNDRQFITSGNKNNILTKTGNNNSWMGCICDNELEKSKESIWKIKILKSLYNFIMVGVAPIDFDINSSNYKYGWYLFCHDSTLYSGEPHNYLHKETNLNKVKDEITIIMNMEKKSLTFLIGNENKGESFKDIPIDKPLAPVVLLYHTDDSVEIDECKN